MPFIQPSQAQKHITHNQAVETLDVLVQLSVISANTASPIANPDLGDSYIVPVGATGEWQDHENAVATKVEGGWVFKFPLIGWRAFVVATDSVWVFGASGWVDQKDTLQNLPAVGVGGTADATNPFTARLNSALWTATPTSEGGSGSVLQTINKEDETADAGFVFQTGYSAKAIMGTFGSDRFRIATTIDGTTFKDALEVDPVSGALSQPNLPKFHAYTNFDNLVPLSTWVKVAINETTFNDQNAFDTTANHFVAPMAGTYFFGGFISFKKDISTNPRLRVRLVKNSSTPVPGSSVELFGKPHATYGGQATSTLVALAAGDTLELQGNYRNETGLFRANETVFWGHKVG